MASVVAQGLGNTTAAKEEDVTILHAAKIAEEVEGMSEHDLSQAIREALKEHRTEQIESLNIGTFGKILLPILGSLLVVISSISAFIINDMRSDILQVRADLQAYISTVDAEVQRRAFLIQDNTSRMQSLEKARIEDRREIMEEIQRLRAEIDDLQRKVR